MHPSYYPLLHIPEATSKKFAIKHFTHPAGKVLHTGTARTAYTGQKSAGPVTYDTDTRWHELLENGSRWMSDLPIEQHQHYTMLDGMHGRILVGGLGLGLAATILARIPAVKGIIVVEKSADVINLVWNHLDPIVRKKASVVHMDLFKYIRQCVSTRYRFDFGFYDIWQGDNEYVFHTVVVPLRRASKGKVREVRCWNEDVMRGQLMHGMVAAFEQLNSPALQMMMHHTPEKLKEILTNRKDKYRRWAVPFWRDVFAHPERTDWGQRAQDYVRTYAL